MLSGLDPRTLIFGLVAVVGTAGGALALLVPLLAVLAVARVLAWNAFQYGWDGQVIRVQQGVLQQRTRSVDAGRIQQVEIEQPILHRLVGLAVLRMETASEGGATEVELAGLPLEEARRLGEALRTSGPPNVDSAGDAARRQGEEDTLLEVSWTDLAVSAVTGARLLVLPAVLAVIAETALDVTDEEQVGGAALGLLGELGIVLAVLLVAVAAVVGAIVTTILRDGGYRVIVRDDEIVVHRGLLTTRATVLPRHRVQVVEMRQNWLRRLLGIVTVHVRSAGGGAATDQARRIQVPLVRPGPDLDALLAALLPPVPAAEALASHPPAALRRAMFRWTAWLAVLATVTVAGLTGLRLLAGGSVSVHPGTGLAVLGTVLLLGVGLGSLEYRNLGHALTADVMASRQGALGIRTTWSPLRRLQGVTERRSPFQRRLGLATVLAHLAGAGATTTITVLDVGSGVAERLREDLTRAAAGA